MEVGLAVGEDSARNGSFDRLIDLFGREDLQLGRSATFLDEFGERCRIRTQTTYEIVDLFGGIVPVNVTQLARKLRCRLQYLGTLYETSLDTRVHIALDYALSRLYNQFRSDLHQFVVHIPGGVGV